QVALPADRADGDAASAWASGECTCRAEGTQVHPCERLVAHQSPPTLRSSERTVDPPCHLTLTTRRAAARPECPASYERGPTRSPDARTWGRQAGWSLRL